MLKNIKRQNTIGIVLNCVLEIKIDMFFFKTVVVIFNSVQKCVCDLTYPVLQINLTHTWVKRPLFLTS